jgi:uncharacterized protein (TIGR03083 family)
VITAGRPGPTREHTVAGLLREYRSFVDLVKGLDANAWRRPTRCVGWQVRDVAGHVVGQLIDTVNGTAGTRLAGEQALEMREHSAGALAAQMQTAAESFARLSRALDDTNWIGPSVIPRFTLGLRVHVLLHDAYIHRDDIRAALAMAPDRGPGLVDSLDFVLGELIRNGAASAEPSVARLLDIPAEVFTKATGVDADKFLLAAIGRLDTARLGLPESVNIYR